MSSDMVKGTSKTDIMLVTQTSMGQEVPDEKL